jgi:hypothetical protein
MYNVRLSTIMSVLFFTAHRFYPLLFPVDGCKEDEEGTVVSTTCHTMTSEQSEGMPFTLLKSSRTTCCTNFIES